MDHPQCRSTQTRTTRRLHCGHRAAQSSSTSPREQHSRQFLQTRGSGFRSTSLHQSVLWIQFSSASASMRGQTNQCFGSSSAVQAQACVVRPISALDPVQQCKRKHAWSDQSVLWIQFSSASASMRGHADSLHAFEYQKSFAIILEGQHNCCEGCTCAFVCVWLHRAARVRAASSFDESAHACT
jgi:hypothetical protein